MVLKRKSPNKRRDDKLEFRKPSIWTWPRRKLIGWLRFLAFRRRVDEASWKIGDVWQKVSRFEGREYRAVSASGQNIVRLWPKTKLLLNPIWWLAWLVQFSWRWAASRPFLPMTLAVPALCFIGVLVGLIATGSQMDRARRAGVYQRLVRRSLDRDQYATAALGADALIGIYPEVVEHRYNRALIHAKANEIEAAKSLMTKLALEENSAKAAMWLAEEQAGERLLKDIPREEKTAIIEWLTLAIENESPNSKARQLKAELLKSMGDARGAYDAILPVADSSLNTKYQAFQLERLLGQDEAARKRADYLIRSIRSLLGDRPQNAELRLQLASILLYVDKDPEAIEIIEAGLEVCPPETRNRLESSKVNAMVVYSGKLGKKENGLIPSIELLRRAMNIDATNRSLIEAIVKICIKIGENENQELQELQKSIANGVGSSASHFINGTIELNKGNVAKASYHLEIAAKENPNLPGLLNNLAYTIIQQEDPDLERALRLSNAAIRNLPNHPYLRETRGQIYLQMKKFTDAIADLEQALPAMELRDRIRPALATAYEAIGDSNMAAMQRKLLSEGK